MQFTQKPEHLNSHWMVKSLFGGVVWLWLLSPASAVPPAGPEESKPRTGPAVGEKIPEFQALDQNGKKRDFTSIRGPKGALIVFYRSADW
jgi:hypothetical protein